MLKKLIAMTIVTTMLLSSFCIIAQADYDSSYTWGQVLTTKGKSTSNGDSTAGDDTSTKSLYLKGSGQENNGAGAIYYLYNGTERLTDIDYIRLNQAYTYSYTASGNYAYNGNIVDIMSDTLMVNTIRYNHVGKSFYSSSSNLRGTLEIRKKTATTFNKSTTMTYSSKIKYSEAFSSVMFTISAQTNNFNNSNHFLRNINALRITNDGSLIAGPNSYNTPLDTRLELNKEYQLDIVIKLIPTSETNKYTLEKTIYLTETETENAVANKIYHGYSENSIVADGVFWRMDIDFEPWAREDFTDYSKLNSTKNYWRYNDNDGNHGAPSEVIKSKYTFIPTIFKLNDFKVYVGDIHADNQPSLANAESDYYITSNVRNNTNYVTVASQTASDDTTASGTVVLATYNNNDELISITTAPMSFTAGAITEQDINISTAGSTKTKLFIVNSTGAMTPLAASTALN